MFFWTPRNLTVSSKLRIKARLLSVLIFTLLGVSRVVLEDLVLPSPLTNWRPYTQLHYHGVDMCYNVYADSNSRLVRSRCAFVGVVRAGPPGPSRPYHGISGMVRSRMDVNFQ